MKSIYTTIAFCLLINLLFAQNERYDFSFSNEAYVPLTNGESFDFDPDSPLTSDVFSPSKESILDLRMNFFLMFLRKICL